MLQIDKSPGLFSPFMPFAEPNNVLLILVPLKGSKPSGTQIFRRRQLNSSKDGRGKQQTIVEIRFVIGQLQPWYYIGAGARKHYLRGYSNRDLLLCTRYQV